MKMRHGTLTLGASFGALAFLIAGCSDSGVESAKSDAPAQNAADAKPGPDGWAGTVRGTVTNLNGDPIEGAFVKLRNSERRLTVMVISKEFGRLPRRKSSLRHLGGAGRRRRSRKQVVDARLRVRHGHGRGEPRADREPRARSRAGVAAPRADGAGLARYAAQRARQGHHHAELRLVPRGEPHRRQPRRPRRLAGRDRRHARQHEEREPAGDLGRGRGRAARLSRRESAGDGRARSEQPPAARAGGRRRAQLPRGAVRSGEHPLGAA